MRRYSITSSARPCNGHPRDDLRTNHYSD